MVVAWVWLTGGRRLVCGVGGCDLVRVMVWLGVWAKFGSFWTGLGPLSVIV